MQTTRFTWCVVATAVSLSGTSMCQEQTLSRPGPAPSLLNPDISVDGLFTGAGFSDPNHVQLGGHDPKVNGITLQNFETTFKSIVDPFWQGIAHVILLIENGKTKVELEEAFMTSLGFPWGLQLIGGQFFTKFGRLNPTHPHSWDFADQPVVNGRMFGGDGLRNPGLHLSWLTPLPFYLQVMGSVQNANGETAPSFINPASAAAAPDNTFLGRPLVARPAASWRDLLYVARAEVSADVTDTLTLLAGGSAAYGPNNTGLSAVTRIYGGDIYLKWQPESTNQGWPFVKWQTEVMARVYDAADYVDSFGAPVDAATIKDQGMYAQLAVGFERPWVAALRLDWVDGFQSTNPLLDRRIRVTPNLTCYPSEFSKVRVQYNYDKPEHRTDPIHAVFVQFEFLMGAHGAHQF